MTFRISWPDGSQSTCYSPSLVIEEYLSEGTSYPLDEFVRRSRTALTIASDRVAEKYGFPCSRAANQIAAIDAAAARFADAPTATAVVTVIEFA